MKPCCVYLEWDSQFFGRRIGRVAENRLTPMSVAEFKEFVKRESAKYLRVIKQTGVTAQ